MSAVFNLTQIVLIWCGLLELVHHCGFSPGFQSLSLYTSIIALRDETASRGRERQQRDEEVQGRWCNNIILCRTDARFSTFCDIKSLLIIFLFPGVDCHPSSSPIRAVQRSQRRFDRCAALHISQGCTLSLSISPLCWIPLWLKVLYRLRLDVNVHVCLMLWLWPPLIQQCHFSALVSGGDLPHLYTNKFKPLICVRLDEERWRAAHCVENRKGWMDISHRVCACVVWRRKETGHQSKIRLKYDTWPAALDERERKQSVEDGGRVCLKWPS